MPLLFYGLILQANSKKKINHKKEEKHLRDLIKSNDKSAFIVVNETKYVENGYFKK